ncbi:MAG: 3-dehydroquinate synthase [Candidatus Bipolaricaulia bacterium]
MGRIDVVLSEPDERSYPIYIGNGLLGAVGSHYRDHGLGPRTAIITDVTVERLYGTGIAGYLADAGVQVDTIAVSTGETAKTLATADTVYDALITGRHERSSTIIALGGGVIGDLAGFVAATFLRGLPLVQIPTTLLAQVDSSVGGKTGVNHRLGKNLIGTFYHPRFVLIDPQVLSTLPERERWAGLVEVIKYGLIRDEQLFRLLESQLEGLAGLQDGRTLNQVIETCCRIKAEVVGRDEREHGLRRILNFGHTIGHALEVATGYERLRHGEAVALGMWAEAWLSHREGLLSQAELARIEDLLDRVPVPDLAEIDAGQLMDRMRSDKKVEAGRIRFVLLERIGEAIVREVNDARILEAIERLQQKAK